MASSYHLSGRHTLVTNPVSAASTANVKIDALTYGASQIGDRFYKQTKLGTVYVGLFF